MTASRTSPSGKRRLISFAFNLNVGLFNAHQTKNQIVAITGLKVTDKLAWIVRPASPTYDGAVVISGAVSTQAGTPVLSLDFSNTSSAGTVLGDLAYEAFVWRS